MNIITKIALSLSLITLVAQSAPDTNEKQMPEAKQAATYTDHAKKAARITLHALQLLLSASLAAVACDESVQRIIAYKNGDLPDDNLSAGVETSLVIVSALAMLNIGYTGLKKEICPDLTSIDLGKKIARIAWHTGKIGGGILFASDVRQNLSRLINKKPLSPKYLLQAAATGLVSATMLNSGIQGLKEEICPNFNPIAWVKNKFNIQSEQTV